jgi:hypothetical protein
VKRITFWLAVGLVSQVSSYALAGAAKQFPNSAFARYHALVVGG